MAVLAKICGLKTEEAVKAAIAGGARYVGFVCYPPSPRHVGFSEVERLAALVPPHVLRVGLFVDPSDDTLASYIEADGLDLIQLHGNESPARIEVIRDICELPIMKAVKVATRADVVAAVETYAGCVQRLLFDAASPPTDAALPGGNGLPFDWRILDGVSIPLPWMLSGGLTPANVAQAVSATGARAVDVSSGVEASRGVKSPELIRAFLAEVAKL